jgi:tetratricopeptide (TPR) repeat protein
MKRSVVGAVLLAAVAVGVVWAALVLVRERRVQNLMASGDQALASDQTFTAIEAFSGAIALKDDSMIAYLKRGEAYRRRGESGAALKDLRTASRLDPSAVRPLELLGDLNYGLGRAARAMESYQAAIALDDHNARIQYKLGLATYRAGDTQAAIDPLRKAVTLDPKLAEASYVLGLCLNDRDHYADAVRAFEEAARYAPAMTAPREALAQLYRHLGRPHEALTQLEALAQLEPDRPERQAAIGLAHARAGHTDTALAVLGRATERYSDNAIVYLTLGRVWLEAAEPRRDRAGLRKAAEALEPLTHGPRISGEALALYGRTLVLAGDVVRGEDALSQASDMLPVSLDTLLWLADAADRLGHAALLRSSLQRWAALAQESNPNLLAVYERIGDLSARAGDLQAAIRAWRKALGTSPSTALVSRLVAAEATAGNLASARDILATALARDPKNPTLLALQVRIK